MDRLKRTAVSVKETAVFLFSVQSGGSAKSGLLYDELCNLSKYYFWAKRSIDFPGLGNLYKVTRKGDITKKSKRK